MMIMPVIEMQCMSFSHDGRYLACVGLDHLNKELIIVWDISRVQRGDKPEIVAKQTSEFNIIDLKFSPIDSTKLASCGKENIKLWTIRDTGNISGKAVKLPNQQARDTVFTCLDMEYGFMTTDKREGEQQLRLFVGTKQGMVYIVNFEKGALESNGIHKTNDAPIQSIAVSEGFVVIGSEDSYLRVWPNDFNGFYMEA
jgi:WD40 repeat protein